MCCAANPLICWDIHTYIDIHMSLDSIHLLYTYYLLTIYIHILEQWQSSPLMYWWWIVDVLMNTWFPLVSVDVHNKHTWCILAIHTHAPTPTHASESHPVWGIPRPNPKWGWTDGPEPRANISQQPFKGIHKIASTHHDCYCDGYCIVVVYSEYIVSEYMLWIYG